MLDRIERKGKLIHECTVAGETRADDVFPGHANGIPLSRDRWLLVYATRGWRGVDDDRSVIYQLRKDRPDGDLIAEGLLRATDDAWDPLGDGSTLSRNHGHPVAFGVPKGAVIDGRPAPHANVFAVKWRVTARDLAPVARGHARDTDTSGRTQFVEWTQCRLNDAEDDIDILQPARPVRQVGCDAWAPFCRHEDLAWMNQTFVQAAPFNDDATEWIDVNHFADKRLAAMKYRFNADTGLYEWTEIGPLLKDPERMMFEASIARAGDTFVIAARSDGGICWMRTSDPFAEEPAVTFTDRPNVNCPIAVYACADGALRLLTGDLDASPYGHGRCPLYAWDVDADTFAVGEPTVICDPIAEGILPRETGPRAEMCKLLPHMGGREQTLLWRIRTKNVGRPYGDLPPVTPEWKEKHGIYRGTLVYSEDQPAMWPFA